MSKVIALMSMSLDGFVADRSDGVAAVFDWYMSSGDVEFNTGGSDPMTFKVSAPSAEHLRRLWSELGAVLTGRRTFDVAHGWDGNHAWGPAFVLTHHIPAGWSGLPGYGPAYAAPWGVVREAYDDVMSGVDRVIALGVADSARVGITGLSYGGSVAAWTIAHTKRFKAAIINAGTYDLLAGAGMSAWGVLSFGVEPWEDPARFLAHSPSTYVGRVVTPTLVLLGERDPLVSLSQGYNLHFSLQRLGVPTEMVIYPGEGHPVLAPKHLIDIGKRHVTWMGRYLGGER